MARKTVLTGTGNAITQAFIEENQGGGTGGVAIEDEGIPVATALTLDFLGAGVTAVVDGGDPTKVNVTIPGGGTVTGVTGTAPIVSSGGAAPAISISAATPSAAGSMSGADKTKLDAFNVFRSVANRAARDAILTWSAGDRCQITGENQFNLAGNVYEYSSTGWQLLGTIWNEAIYGGWDADGAQLFYYAALTEEWAQSTAYSIDDVRRAPAAIGEHVYTCTTAGTSAGAGTGPSGTGTGIADGTAVWSFVGRALLAIPQLIHGGAFVQHEIEGPGDGLPAGIVYDATVPKKQGFIAYLIGGASGFSDGISFGITHFLHADQ